MSEELTDLQLAQRAAQEAAASATLAQVQAQIATAALERIKELFAEETARRNAEKEGGE